MSAVKFPYGKPVKLLIDLQGFPDGRLVQFEIWRKEGQREEKVAEVNGVIKGGKGVGEWNPEWKEDKRIPTLADKITAQVQSETYYFIAKIDDKQAKSGDIIFISPLDIYLTDEKGKPINDVKFTITFSDKTKRKGVFKDGHARFDDAPPGVFDLELEDYDFVFT